MSTDLTVYEPRNFGELEAFANRVTRTNLVPQAYRGKPDDALVAMMFGKETGGLGPLTSLQFIAVINGRPGYYSDAVPGVALNKGLIRDIEIAEKGEPFHDDYRKVITITKANGNKTRSEFSVADAKRAGLWDKAGPWKQYPKRMLQWRAIGYGVRDAAPHLLFGNTVEELRDLEEQPHIGAERAKDITPQDRARAAAPPPTAILVIDPEGEERGLAPGEAPEVIRQWARECTDEQLGWLIENNDGVELVASIVEAERTTRIAKTKAGDQDPDPLRIDGLSAKEALGTLQWELERCDATRADQIYSVYRERIAKFPEKIKAALDKLVADKIEGEFSSEKRPVDQGELV